MVSLRERAQAQEIKYTHEQTWMFRAEARRNKLIGLWAGEALSHEDPHAYAAQLAEWAVEHPSERELLAKLQRDFDAASVSLNVGELTTRMHGLLAEILEEMQA